MSRSLSKIALSAAVLTALASACVAETEPETVGKSPEALTASTIEAVAVVGAVAAALEPVAEAQPMEGDAPEAGGDATPTPGLGEEMPAEAGCTALEWNIREPLRVVIHFDECITEAGDIIDGSVTAWLEYDGVPGAIGVALDNLALGDLAIDGFVVLRNAGPAATAVDADISFVTPEQSTRIMLDGTVSTTGDVLQLDGSAALTVDADAWTTDARLLRWEDPGSCYPTSGALDIDAPGQPPMTVTFEGESVTVAIGVLTIPWTLPACPGS